MAAVQLTCEIDGCGMSWSVSSPARMKASVAEHRKSHHPAWKASERKTMDAYRLDYSNRSRQF